MAEIIEPPPKEKALGFRNVVNTGSGFGVWGHSQGFSVLGFRAAVTSVQV